MVFSDETRARYARLLAGLTMRNPFVRFLLSALVSSLVLTAVLHRVARVCWHAVRSSDSTAEALLIYFAGCLTVGVCATVLVEGTRPWVDRGSSAPPSSIADVLIFPLASIPIGLIFLPIVVLMNATSFVPRVPHVNDGGDPLQSHAPSCGSS